MSIYSIVFQNYYFCKKHNKIFEMNDLTHDSCTDSDVEDLIIKAVYSISEPKNLRDIVFQNPDLIIKNFMEKGVWTSHYHKNGNARKKEKLLRLKYLELGHIRKIITMLDKQLSITKPSNLQTYYYYFTKLALEKLITWRRYEKLKNL